jgi:type II secretion system protein N
MNTWVRGLALALAAIVLTLLFVAWLFPYERVADRLSDRATSWSGIELRFEDVGPTLSWGGVGLEAVDARATLPRGDAFVLPRLFLRPAWSPRWLLGDPQLVIQIDGGTLGRLDGVVGLGRGGSWDARLEDVRVGVLPLDQLVPGLAMEGLLTGRIEVARDDAGLAAGQLEVAFEDGSLQTPGLPIAVPYERLSADIGLGGEVAATVRALALAGPMLSATLSGTVGRGARPGAEPLDLDMQIQRVGRALQPLLRDLGIELARAGPTRLEITGTLARPTFR